MSHLSLKSQKSEKINPYKIQIVNQNSVKSQFESKTSAEIENQENFLQKIKQKKIVIKDNIEEIIG